MQEDIYGFLEEINNQEYAMIILFAFIGVCIFIEVLRILVTTGYQSQLTIFRLNSKELKSEAEIKNIKGKLLSSVVNDYINMGKKEIGNINQREIVVRYVQKLNMFGWSFESMERFVLGYEQGMLFIGILLTMVFQSHRYVFAIAASFIFIFMRLISSIFDVNLVKDKLINEISQYVSREIGQFYSGDLNSIILRLKNETSSSIMHQSDAITKSIDKLGVNIAGVLNLSMQEMSKSIEKTLVKISDVGSILDEPLKKWSKVISDGVILQEKINLSSENLDKITENFKNISEKMEIIIADSNMQNEKQIQAMKENMNELVDISKCFEYISKNIDVSGMSLEKTLEYVSKNQIVLEETITKYEQTLLDISAKIGSGIGDIIDFHTHIAYKKLNEELAGNISQIINSNNELLLKLQKTFEKIYEQSQSETRAIINLKEQIDIRIDEFEKNR